MDKKLSPHQYQKLHDVLVTMINSSWVSFWVLKEDKNSANELLKLGLLVIEDKPPQKSGDAPLGAWKLKDDIRTKIINKGTQLLLAELSL